MKTVKQAERDARRLFRLVCIDGSVDDRRVRGVVKRLIAPPQAGNLLVLSRFQRLVRLNREQHSARVTSAALLPAEIRSQLETAVARMYGPGIEISFTEDPTLLGGIRLRVGSDVYDGTVQGRLMELADHF